MNMYLPYDFPGGSDGKASVYNAGDIRDVRDQTQGSIPGLGRYPGGGHGDPLQYYCLEKPMDREAWWATVHGIARVGYDLAPKPPPLS